MSEAPKMPEWLMADHHTPQEGWCACADGGAIWLDYWTDDGWLGNAPHGTGDVLEFHQVTVTAAFNKGFEDFDFEPLRQYLELFTPWGQRDQS